MLNNIITIYQTMTGNTVPTAQIPQYTAWGRRAIRELENKLGWQFDRTAYINVLGVSPSGCNCDVAESALKPAPTQRGQYRAFNFNEKQPFVMTDPFIKIHNVYICRIEPEGRFITSDNNDVVILKQIEKYSPRYFNNEFGKSIQSCEEMTACQRACEGGCTKCSALLVDADWCSTSNAPDELKYLICDYMDWMANGGVATRNVKSESVDGHTVQYGNDGVKIEPYENSTDSVIIKQYAGPYGMADRKLIW